TCLGRRGQAVILLALIIFLLVPFIFTNNMTLMLRPEVWQGYFENASGTLLNWGEPTLIPRYLHFVLGGLAVGSLFVAVYSRFAGRDDYLVEQAGVNLGMGLFTWLTLLQMIDGMLFFILLPGDVQQQFLGGSPLASGIFLLAFCLALLALAAGFRRKVTLAALVVVPLVYLMAEIRAMVRSGYLQPHFTLEQLKVDPQISPLFLFLGVLLVGIALIAWILWRWARAMRYGE
ncbi:MAG TPA: hypothetical protein VJ910_11935, partial [Desulfuromonadales bacterium]|nr:hypothetical protein [Desulfuromonadales bacterium]